MGTCPILLWMSCLVYGISGQSDIRLVGGNHTWEGRVEVYVNGAWGTVCDDGWGVQDAQVVCRQLGYSTSQAQAFSGAHFGSGATWFQIWLDDVACTGYESRLTDCSANALGNNDCSHYEDAGVSCGTGDIRLVGGPSSREGRVEVFANGQWGTVCDDLWDEQDAAVVCRHLGYDTTGASARLMAAYGEGSGPILLDDVNCLGSESTIWQCTAQPVGTHNCAHGEDAGVSCGANIRLVGGPSSREGRVEVFANGQWGTVCDDLWDDQDAAVVCRHLGYDTTGSTTTSMAAYGEGTGPILLDNVNCYGSESSIWQCPANAVGSHDCTHGEDAGVRCNDQFHTVTPDYSCYDCNYWFDLDASVYNAIYISAGILVPLLVVIIAVIVCKCCCRTSANSTRVCNAPAYPVTQTAQHVISVAGPAVAVEPRPFQMPGRMAVPVQPSVSYQRNARGVTVHM